MNGNIRTLNRAGVAVDNLTYNYSGNGNRLTSIANTGANGNGLKNGTSTYSYDANGNMISDGNRGATITYNYLNLPKTVAVNSKTITYDYDASGAKHKYTDGTSIVKYAGAFEYDNTNGLKRIGTTEGQVIPAGDTLRFEYYLKDHLGNVRVVFDESGEIVQKTDYYPFGLSIPRSGNDAVNRYLFQGQEKQPEIATYDFGARMYDPAIGRTFQVDPMAEGYYPWSPYGWVMNNPLKFMDPTGMFSTHTDEDGNVVAVYDDGDLGVYKHGGQVTKADIDSKHNTKNTSAGGQKMGETEFWDEFRNPETGKEIGTLNFGESWDNTIADLHNQSKGMDLLEIRTESKLRGDFDIKNREDLAPSGPFTGKLLNGKYASARSAGNYLAGYNAARGTQYGVGFTRTGYLKLAGAYNMTGELTTSMILGIVLRNDSYGPAPYYGEAPYSGRRIIQGWDNKKHGK